MAKQTSNTAVAEAERDCSFSATTIAALLFLAAKFPHRQFNSNELCVLSGIGRTAMSQIKNADDSPFSLGKCTLQRLDGWLAKHPGFKQQWSDGKPICQKGSQKHYDPRFACADREATVRGIWAQHFHSVRCRAGLL